MNATEPNKKLIMRLFHARAKSGRAAELIEKFASTSADVVQHEPGNKGYFFGEGVELDRDLVIFASLWEDLSAIKARFGDHWQVSFLPEGYADLIEECWIQHLDVGASWHLRIGS